MTQQNIEIMNYSRVFEREREMNFKTSEYKSTES